MNNEWYDLYKFFQAKCKRLELENNLYRSALFCLIIYELHKWYWGQ